MNNEDDFYSEQDHVANYQKTRNAPLKRQDTYLKEKIVSIEIRMMDNNMRGCKCDSQKRFQNENSENNRNKLKENI